jgi:hypothetical protein
VRRPTPPSGRRPRARIFVIVVLMTSAALAACAGSGPAHGNVVPITGSTTETGPSGTSPGRLVMIIRHAEKPDGSSVGVDSRGNRDDASLTEVGWNRAHRLVNLFAPAQGSPRPGLDRPRAIYAARANKNGEGTRTRETVQPLADELGITVNTSFGKGDERALAEQIMAQPGPTLVSWQHGEIPAVVAAFPSVTPPPPSTWPDNRFDVIWTLTRTADGWHFTQLPELVLPQDQAAVIDS